MNRRHFFCNTAASLLAPAAGLAEGTRIRVGILGTRHSHFSGKCNALLDSPDYEVVGIAESEPAAAALARQSPRFSALRWITEDELLGDSSIQLIVVECRIGEAIPLGRRVIAAGRHLHLEKPPGNEWAPFKELVEEARSRNRLLQTGYVWRWHQGIVAALDAARKGWLGEVFLVRATMNADRGPEQRAMEARFKGGGMFELGGHMIDPVVELLGRPKAVKSWLRHDTSVPDKLADNNLAVFEYDRALAVIAQANKMAGAGDHRSFEIVGTDGTVIVHPESSPPRMRVYMRNARGPYRAGWQDLTLPPQPRYVPDFAALARSIKSGQPLKHSYEHELLLHETLLRASGEMD